MSRDIGVELEHAGSQSKFLSLIDPEVFGCYYFHPIAEKDFFAVVQFRGLRMGVFSNNRFSIIKTYEHHESLLGTLQKILERDYLYTIGLNLAPHLLENSIENTSIHIAVVCAMIRKMNPEMADSLKAMSERVYKIECVAPSHLIGSFCDASEFASRLNEQHQAKATRH